LAGCILLGVALCRLPTGWLVGPALAEEGAAPAPGQSLQLELPPEPFVPAEPRTPADRRRLESLALFATARAAHQREEHATALRLYQRALRLDPHSAATARAIVPLAFRLKRPAVAVRYALRAVELEEADPVLLRRLGMYLAEQGEWEQAVKLYERTLQARGDQQETAADILVRMESGRLCHLIERHEKAAEHFARVLHALEHPKDFALDEETTRILLGDPGTTYCLFGDCFLLAGRLDEAEAAYRMAEQAAPNPGRFELNRARVFLQGDQPEKALQALKQAFEHKLDPENAMPYRVLVDVLGRLDRSDEVLPHLEALREKQRDGAALRQVLAEEYLDRDKLDEAAELFEELLEQSPTLAGFRGLAEAYRRGGKVEPLLRVVGQLAGKTGMLDALGPEGEKLAGDAELFAKLTEAARQRMQQPDSVLDHGRALAVALLALDSGQFEAAAEFFDAALETRPDRAAEIFATWGIGLLLGEQPRMAAEVFRRAIDRGEQPDANPLFYFYLAGALELDGHTDDALEAARKAVELTPDSPRLHSRVGWVFYHAGRYEEAIDAYRHVIDRFDAEHTSADTRDVLREARLILSSLYVLQDDSAGAEPWLEEVLDEFPDDPGALNDLGYLWADQDRNLDLALEMIERAVAANPENAAFRDSLGWVYYRLGRFEEAVVELEKAVGQEEEPDAIILDHLGDAYAAAGQTEKARNAWHRAAEAFREADQPQKAAGVEKKITSNADSPDSGDKPAANPDEPEPTAAITGPSPAHS
jgi:tetratricopeptide (TPR) repeat protein